MLFIFLNYLEILPFFISKNLLLFTIFLYKIKIIIFFYNFLILLLFALLFTFIKIF
jgi:hypothetical protein